MTLDGQGPGKNNVADALDALVTALAAESSSLSALEHRLASLAALLSHSRAQYLDRATTELAEATGELEDSSSTRQHAASTVGAFLGLAPDASLAELAQATPPPFDGALAQLRADLLAARARVVQLRDSTTGVLGAQISLVNDALAEVDESGPSYGRSTRSTPRLLRSVL